MKTLLLSVMLLCAFGNVGYSLIENHYKYVDYIKLINSKISVSDAIRIEKGIILNAKRYKIPEPVLLSIIKRESSFNKYAIGRLRGKAKDYGLMQLNAYWWLKNMNNPSNLLKIGVIKYYEDLFKISKNMKGGSIVFNVTRDICHHLIKRGKTKESLLKCTIRKYNGSKRWVYYDKIINNIRQYHDFIAERALMDELPDYLVESERRILTQIIMNGRRKKRHGNRKPTSS